MKGIICMWSGLLVDIPNGWALCDGSNGTPDMRNRFVVGPTTAQDPGGKGGAATHRHSAGGSTGANSVSHQHIVDGETGPPEPGDFDYSYDEGFYQLYGDHVHVLTCDSDDESQGHTHDYWGWSAYSAHYPKFLKLAFIMKL